jgi:uncharacterized protein
LFADLDLQKVCPVVCLARQHYPQGLVALMKKAPAAPWMYTGALENWPRLVGKLAQVRPLWGNRPSVLRQVRHPWRVEAVLREAGLACPKAWDCSRPPPQLGRWLVKPLAGAGGRGITEWQREQTPGRGFYLQEFIEGTACSAVYIAAGERAVLLGVTRQLIGEPWLFASGFQYCGSVGPLALGDATRSIFAKLGDVYAKSFALRGLFGVDCVLRDGVPFAVEINPRYTASVEVLERALGIQALTRHWQAFHSRPTDAMVPAPPRRIVGKAILFARHTMTVPAIAPWSVGLDQSWTELRAFADIPPGGDVITQGQPVMTIFAQADSVASCIAALKNLAREVNWLLPDGTAK